VEVDSRRFFMRKSLVVLALVLGVFVLGSGVSLFADPMSTTDPQVGITRDALVQSLGQPASTASDGNGGTILVYLSMEAIGAESPWAPNPATDQYYVDASGKVFMHRHSVE
jgi:hypothetical protein